MALPMKKTEIEDIELNLLMDAIYQRYGYDFRHYARASVERRAKQFSVLNGFKHISEMIPAIINNESLFEKLVREFSVTVTELFRDPVVYQKITELVFPKLSTYPFIRVWHAGCATGEEVYSLAILLHEKGLYERSRIYGTDFNDEALDSGRQGIYKIDSVKNFTSNYQKAGGSHSLSEYYNARYDSISIIKSLKKNITFANHNLVSDGIFGEMHLVFCRNVLIYFDKVLQNRVLNLLCDCLVNGGYLCLGSIENLIFTDVENKFDLIDEKGKIYQKKYLARDTGLSETEEDFKCIVIGVSAGGLNALSVLLSGLKDDLKIPVIITQHLNPDEKSNLTEILSSKSRIKIIEVEDNMAIMPNRIYIGPPDHHLHIEENHVFSLSRGVKVKYSRPSIDVLFKSASKVYLNRMIGIILTGANDDGAEGIKTIRENGGWTIAQNTVEAEFSTMPQSSIDTGMIDKVLDLQEIAELINSI
jgi:chemotaxis protein methyltransferase CheR